MESFACGWFYFPFCWRKRAALARQNITYPWGNLLCVNFILPRLLAYYTVSLRTYTYTAGVMWCVCVCGSQMVNYSRDIFVDFFYLFAALILFYVLRPANTIYSDDIFAALLMNDMRYIFVHFLQLSTTNLYTHNQI